MFQKVLIANRGEIAIRIIRSCRELGIDTVSVHSDVDEQSLHVKMADESICIGPRKASDSYLNFQAILTAAEITGADAIHPGYGFMSENSKFAELAEKCGLAFIGPHTESMKVMGDKIRSKEFAKQVGLPILETIEIDLINESIKEKIKKVGYPVLLKASAGGGGRGMSVINDEVSLAKMFPLLKEEARNAFGDDTIFAEKYIANPRHIEVQVLGDKFGHIIHLGERDCSVQRRYQKLIEESPSSILSDAARGVVTEYALRLSKEIKYDSAGTVEFLYDQDAKKFYFMEMNTRIQVEHPVTEERTNIDLISEQIKIAAGKHLEIAQKDVEFSGHVIECRINAEDPITFAPRPGLIDHYHRPGGLGVRVDDYIYTGYKVSPFYDSLISKIIVKAQDRNSAIIKMNRCLSEMIVGGIETNISLHEKVLKSKEFQSGNYSTHIIKNIF